RADGRARPPAADGGGQARPGRLTRTRPPGLSPAGEFDGASVAYCLTLTGCSRRRPRHRAMAPRSRPPPTTGIHGCSPVSASLAGATAGPPTFGPLTVAVPSTAAPLRSVAEPFTAALFTKSVPAAPPLQLLSVAVTLTVFWSTPAPELAGMCPLIVNTRGGSPGW